MLSRRIIRVKVMQTLYSIDSMPGMDYAGVLKMLQTSLRHSSELFTYLVSILLEVALFAEKDATTKAQKHLPTSADLNVNRKIAGNEFVLAIASNPTFVEARKNFKTRYLLDENLIRKCYFALTATPEYRDYLTEPLRDRRTERKILEFIFNTLMLPDDNIVSDVEEKFMHWQDDADMMIVLMTTLLQKPPAFDFNEISGKEKTDFAVSLLHTVMDKKDLCHELIKPKLKNWDADRIATLDMILMEMGVCEFLFFETIPPRVTINEYIDLAKEYSTEQSGHFVNGILDSIHKDLVAAGRITKKSFKNSVL